MIYGRASVCVYSILYISFLNDVIKNEYTRYGWEKRKILTGLKKSAIYDRKFACYELLEMYYVFFLYRYIRLE